MPDRTLRRYKGECDETLAGTNAKRKKWKRLEAAPSVDPMEVGDDADHMRAIAKKRKMSSRGPRRRCARASRRTKLCGKQISGAPRARRLDGVEAHEVARLVRTASNSKRNHSHGSEMDTSRGAELTGRCPRRYENRMIDDEADQIPKPEGMLSLELKQKRLQAEGKDLYGREAYELQFLSIRWIDKKMIRERQKKRRPNWH